MLGVIVILDTPVLVALVAIVFNTRHLLLLGRRVADLEQRARGQAAWLAELASTGAPAHLSLYCRLGRCNATGRPCSGSADCHAPAWHPCECPCHSQAL